MELRELQTYGRGYKVSECGTVIISPKTGKHLNLQDNTWKGQVTGYKYVTLVFHRHDSGLLGYGMKRVAVHILVCTLWHGERPDNKPWVNHKDGNRSNNHYTNLEWSSISENIQHSYTVLGRKPPRNMLGKKHKVSTKEKMSFAKQGEKHPKFKGWYERNGNRYATTVEAGKAQGISSMSVLRKVKAGKDDWIFVPKES